MSDLAARQQRILTLEKALEPFAKLAGRINPLADDAWDALGVTVKVGDLRRARAALNDHPPRDEAAFAAQRELNQYPVQPEYAVQPPFEAR